MSVVRRLRRCWPSHGENPHETTKSEGSPEPAKTDKQKAISVSSEDTVLDKSTIDADKAFLTDGVRHIDLPVSQQQLQLHSVGQEFSLIRGVALPELSEGEILIQVKTVGLNPIDWKAPAFGWGLPSLPCVLGRDLVGTVVRDTVSNKSLKVGSVVGAISTDYRDYRKAAFQQYAVASWYNVYRIPQEYHNAQQEVASLGVAFVTATLAFGVCLGGILQRSKGEIVDLLSIARSIPAEDLPDDIRNECANPRLGEHDRPKRGDWIIIWGGGSSVGFILVQLAKSAGLKVICVADAIKTGYTLVDAGADVIVHRNDPEEAVKVIAGVTKGRELKYGIDTVGKETSHLVQSTLRSLGTGSRHIVGLVGLPKVDDNEHTVHQHKVPIKLFHEAPAIGTALTRLLEDTLRDERLILPTVHVHHHRGLEGVNSGLKLLRSGESDAQRIVVPIQ